MHPPCLGQIGLGTSQPMGMVLGRRAWELEGLEPHFPTETGCALYAGNTRAPLMGPRIPDQFP